MLNRVIHDRKLQKLSSPIYQGKTHIWGLYKRKLILSCSDNFVFSATVNKSEKIELYTFSNDNLCQNSQIQCKLFFSTHNNGYIEQK